MKTIIHARATHDPDTHPSNRTYIDPNNIYIKCDLQLGYLLLNFCCSSFLTETEKNVSEPQTEIILISALTFELYQDTGHI